MEKVISKILKESVEENKITGLHLISSPTGSAKSYTSVQQIKKYYSKLNKAQRIFFITNNLNNLPIEDFKKSFGKDYYKNVIRVESIIDNINHNFNSKIIPDKFKDLDSFKELERAIENYRFYNKKSIERNIAPTEQQFLEKAEKDLTEADKHFRTQIHNELIKTGFKKLSPSEKKQIIKSKYHWLIELYPSILLDDYKVICMSTKKFLSVNDTIFNGKYKINENKISENSIIFIDEFDATKNEINKTILENSINSNIELIPLINKIVTKFLGWDHQVTNEVKHLINDNGDYFNLLKERANMIRNKYHDDLTYYCNQIRQRNFLMCDTMYHPFFEDAMKKNAYVYYDRNSNRMEIVIADNREEIESGAENVYSLYSVVREMIQFLFNLKKFLALSSRKYVDYKNNTTSNEEDKISENEALHSFYNLFSFNNSEKNFFDLQIKPFKSKYKDLNEKLTNTKNYYDSGIKHIEFTNSKHNSFNTIFRYISIDESAESILVELAKKATIIGLSATCTINSTLSNYNLDYLKDKLKDNYHVLSSEDELRIRSTYNKLNKKYHSNEIKVVIKEINQDLGYDNDLETLCKKVFKKTQNYKTAKNILKNFSYYNAYRYLMMCKVYEYFLRNEDIKSFLCLNNALPKKNGDFNLEILEKLYKKKEKELGILGNKVKYCVLKGGASFESDKKKLLNDLAKGEKIFVISSYATLGAGQNLAYKLPDGIECVNLTNEINPNDSRNQKKDFDGIFLGPVTHAITNLSDVERKFTEYDLMNYIIELENLFENNEINSNILIEGIRNGYGKLSNNFIIPQNIMSNTNSVFLFKSKQIIQALGRLSRSFNKNSTIHVLVTKKIYEELDGHVIDNQILSPETEQLAKYVIRKQEEDKEDYFLINRASKKATQGKAFISGLVYSVLSGNRIAIYKELGETSLKYPTCSESFAEINEYVKNLYLTDESNKNKYYYVETGDFSYTRVFFYEEKSKVKSQLRFENQPGWVLSCIREFSENNSRLPLVLNYPGMREMFEKKGYATSFKTNYYMMSPIIYQNIYKGRLGEVAGKFVIENELNIKLNELPEEIYEKFDFEFNNVYIDFKLWYKSDFDSKTEKEKYRKKLEEVGGKKVLIINIFDSDILHKINESESVIEIPRLLERDGMNVDTQSIDIIRRELGDHQCY